MAFSEYKFNKKTGILTVDEGVTKIPNNAFIGNKKLKRVVLPNSVTEIGAGAFCNCTKLETINLPEGLRVIGQGAFELCCSLGEIIIPDTITTIECCAFGACPKARILANKNNKNLCSVINDSFVEGIDSVTITEEGEYLVFKDMQSIDLDTISMEKATNILLGV